MKILHTSDWHLGQLFYGKSREQEQTALLDWLIGQVSAQAIDAVLVAGDLFDTGTPPSYARRLYNQFIVRLHQTCPQCQLILLAGNHDSVAVLNESKDLLQALNTRVIAGADTGLAEDADSDALNACLIPLTGSDGSPEAVLCAVPFLRPRDLMRSRAGQSSEERRQQLQEEIRVYYQRLYQAAKAQYPQLPVVMTGHLTTVGASTSESVKEIYIGTLDAFPAAAFPDADYIALGHIHRPQKVAGSEHIRYSGSPVPLSFDELNREKQMLLVELHRDTGLQAVTPLPVPVFQPMQRISGDLDAIEQALQSLQTQLDSLPEGQDLWLEITVTTEHYLADLQPRIEAMTAFLPVEILRIRRQQRERRTLADQPDSVQLDELTPDEVFSKRLDLDETLTDERRRLLTECFRQIRESDPL